MESYFIRLLYLVFSQALDIWSLFQLICLGPDSKKEKRSKYAHLLAQGSLELRPTRFLQRQTLPRPVHWQPHAADNWSTEQVQHGDSTVLQHQVLPRFCSHTARQKRDSESFKSYVPCFLTLSTCSSFSKPWALHTYQFLVSSYFQNSSNLWVQKFRFTRTPSLCWKEKAVFLKCFHPTLHEHLKLISAEYLTYLKDLHKTPALRVANKNT